MTDSRHQSEWFLRAATALVTMTVLVFAAGLPILATFVSAAPDQPVARVVWNSGTPGLPQTVSVQPASGWWLDEAEGRTVNLVSRVASLSLSVASADSEAECVLRREEAEAQLRSARGVARTGPSVRLTVGGQTGSRVTYGSGLVGAAVSVLCREGMAVVAVSIAPRGSSGSLEPVDVMLASVRSG